MMVNEQFSTFKIKSDKILFKKCKTIVQEIHDYKQ